MTEFTSEFITNWKHAIKVVAGVRGEMREVEKFALEALDEIERLQARVQELEQEQERRWISVGERLPEDGQLVIGWNWVSQTVAVVRYHKLTGKFYEYWRGGDMTIKYWQPLPQPPKEGE